MKLMGLVLTVVSCGLLISIWFNSMYAKSAVNTWGTWIGNCLLSISPGSPAVEANFDNASGLLTVTGDDAANSIKIERSGNLVFVWGLAGTKINCGPVYVFQSPESISLDVRTNGGDDSVKLIGLDLQQANIGTGEGNDQLTILLSTIADLNADGGEGVNTLVTTSSNITTAQIVNFP